MCEYSYTLYKWRTQVPQDEIQLRAADIHSPQPSQYMEKGMIMRMFICRGPCFPFSCFCGMIFVWSKSGGKYRPFVPVHLPCSAVTIPFSLIL